MKRPILACLAGFLTWIVVVSIIDRILRVSLANYTAAEHTLQFTLAMKWARLAMALVTSVVAGTITRWIAPASRWTACVVGIVVLAIFLPMHISIWPKFPVWYHLAFLLTIVPAVWLGSLLPSRRPGSLSR